MKTIKLPTVRDVVKRVKAAYVKISLPPCRGAFRHYGGLNGVEVVACCGMTALLAAETGLDLDSDESIEAYVMKTLPEPRNGRIYDWLWGFARGFDGNVTINPSEAALQGYKVGTLAAKAIFDPPLAAS